MARKRLGLETLGGMKRIKLRRHIPGSGHEESRRFRPCDRGDFIVVARVHSVENKRREFSYEMGRGFPNMCLVAVCNCDVSVSPESTTVRFAN